MLSLPGCAQQNVRGQICSALLESAAMKQSRHRTAAISFGMLLKGKAAVRGHNLLANSALLSQENVHNEKIAVALSRVSRVI